MSEEETKSVNNQEVAATEVKSEEQKPVQSSEPTQEKVKPTEGSKEYNFARLRKEKEELERQLKEAREEQEKYDPDDILTVAQAKKLAEKQAKETVDKALKEYEYSALPKKTKSQFSDYEQVMTEENIKKLETEEPGLAEACAKAANPWEATYKILKKFVIKQEEKKGNSEEKLNENLKKPVSSNSVGKHGPLADANLWSEASKNDLYKEMMEAAARAN